MVSVERRLFIPNGVARWAPHNFSHHISHTAPILDVWRQSERSDTDEECVVTEATVGQTESGAPKTRDVAAPGGVRRATKGA